MFGRCSCHTLPVPPMMQLGQPLHASSLYLTRVLLTCLTVPPITQPVQSPHTSSLYLTHVVLMRTTSAADTVACAVSERLGTLHDPGTLSRHELCRRRCYSLSNLHTSDFYSTQDLLAPPTVPLMLHLVQSLHASGFLLDPGSPRRHELCGRYCKLCSLRTPRVFTRPGCSWHARANADAAAYVVSERSGPLFVPGCLAGMNFAAGDAVCAVMTQLTMF